MRGIKTLRVCVVTFPISEAGTIPLSQLIDILHAVSKKVYLITGDAAYVLFREDERIHTYGIRHETRGSLLPRIISYISTQLRISYRLLKIIADVDICIFYMGGEGLLLPLLTARLLRKKVVLSLAGFPAKSSQARRDPLAKATGFLSEINLALSNKVIAYSEKIIEERGLNKYKEKVSIAHEHFIDFDKFGMQKPLSERDNLVGYIGRLSGEKGILNFIQALPVISSKRDGISFRIGGDGALRGKVEEHLDKTNLNRKVNFVGWIPHNELPKHLNDLKLLVLPSYTEGLPNIMLEAVACGTPVLATAVGAIPDVIKDGETGFIMEDNSPECIARNVIRTLSHPNLEQIAENAHALVEKEYNFEAAVKGYENVLASLK